MASKVIVNAKDVRSDISVTDLKSVIASTLVAAEIILDPDTLNQYLNHQLSLSENAVLSFSKTATADALTFADIPAAAFGLGKSDGFSFIDSPLVEMHFARAFTDAFSLDDVTAVDAVIKDVAADKTNVFVFSDSQSLGVDKGLADSVTFVDDGALFQMSKGLSNSFNVSEVLSSIVTYNRSFSDSQSFNDAADSRDIAKGFSDTQTMAEAHAASTSLGKTDNYALADSLTQSFDKAAADSVSLSESLARTVAFSRTFTDAFSLDDALTFPDTELSKTNVFSFSDSQAFGFSKAATDTFSFADDEDIEFGKGLSDSVSITDNFSFALISSAAMNAATLNSAPFNQ